MTNHKMLIECIRSGQLSAAQIHDHMRDPVFLARYRKHLKSPFNPPVKHQPASLGNT